MMMRRCEWMLDTKGTRYQLLISIFHFIIALPMHLFIADGAHNFQQLE